MRTVLVAVCFLGWTAAPFHAQQDALPKAPADVKPGSITYDDIAYPFAVAYFPLTLYGQDVRMAYMDVPPAGPPNGRTVVLFHGMNFGGFYFGGPIETLRKEGFRVVVPDQIGFGRSSRKALTGRLVRAPSDDHGSRSRVDRSRPPGSCRRRRLGEGSRSDRRRGSAT